MVDVVAALEEGSAAEEFGEDATDGPDVDSSSVSGSSDVLRVCIHTCFRIALEAEHNLRGSIPSSGNVLRHEAGIFVGVRRKASGKTEITDLELAVGVY